jgi:hypothetical protein
MNTVNSTDFKTDMYVSNAGGLHGGHCVEYGNNDV